MYVEIFEDKIFCEIECTCKILATYVFGYSFHESLWIIFKDLCTYVATHKVNNKNTHINSNINYYYSFAHTYIYF